MACETNSWHSCCNCSSFFAVYFMFFVDTNLLNVYRIQTASFPKNIAAKCWCVLLVFNIHGNHPRYCSVVGRSCRLCDHYSLSGRTSYCKISRNLEGARPGFSLCSVALKLDKHLDRADELPTKFTIDTICVRPNLAALWLHKFWRQDVRPLSECRLYICDKRTI